MKTTLKSELKTRAVMFEKAFSLISMYHLRFCCIFALLSSSLSRHSSLVHFWSFHGVDGEMLKAPL
jgi:hypothetical protein